MAAIEQNGKAPAKGTPDHFVKLLEGPCPNAYLVKHLYKDCSLMKRFMSGVPREGIRRGSPTPRRTTLRRRRVPF
jgi:hypothetical protein